MFSSLHYQSSHWLPYSSEFKLCQQNSWPSRIARYTVTLLKRVALQRLWNMSIFIQRRMRDNFHWYGMHYSNDKQCERHAVDGWPRQPATATSPILQLIHGTSFKHLTRVLLQVHVTMLLVQNDMSPFVYLYFTTRIV